MDSYILSSDISSRRRFRTRNEVLTKSLKGLKERKPLGFWSQGYSTAAEMQMSADLSVCPCCLLGCHCCHCHPPTVECGVWPLPALLLVRAHLLTWSSMERWQSGIAFFPLSKSLMNTPKWQNQFTPRSPALRIPGKYVLCFPTSPYRR